MILVKGSRVILEQADGTKIRMPKSYGIIHDPEGEHIHRCEVLLGPYKILRRKPPAKTSAAKYYFGKTYDHKAAQVDPPKGPWRQVAKVVKIYYFRHGSRAPYGFHHPFRGKPLDLAKCGRFYLLSLPDGCIVDDRGFSWP